MTLTDTEYKCESCVLSPGQDVSNKFMEIDRAISTQKTLGNGGNLNDNTINNPVDLLTPANNANIESGGTGPPHPYMPMWKITIHVVAFSANQ